MSVTIDDDIGIFLLGYCPENRHTHQLRTHLVERLAFEMIALEYINKFCPTFLKNPAISFQVLQLGRNLKTPCLVHERSSVAEHIHRKRDAWACPQCHCLNYNFGHS